MEDETSYLDVVRQLLRRLVSAISVRRRKQLLQMGLGTLILITAVLCLSNERKGDTVLPTVAESPVGIRLRFGTSDKNNHSPKLMVQFSTVSTGTPVAMIGTSNPPKTKVTGTSTAAYTATDMCGAPANETSPDISSSAMEGGMLHTVEFSLSESNQLYYYKVGLASGQGILWSDISSFTSPPVAPADDSSFSFIVYGDQGVTEGADRVLNQISQEIRSSAEDENNNPVRFVHIVGGLSYAKGVGHLWKDWLAKLSSSFASKVPLMVGVGAPEYDHVAGGANGKDPSGVETSDGFHPKWGNFGDDSGGECGVPVSRLFPKLQPPSSDADDADGFTKETRISAAETENDNAPFWYSYEVESVHMTVISSEHDLSIGSSQYSWLEQDLKQVNRTSTPWLILSTYRPLYNGFLDFENNDVGIGMRMEIEDLLREYDVDLVLSGRYRSYHRTCDGLHSSVCDRGGPTHVTVGTGGVGLTENVQLYPNMWSKKSIPNQYGYGLVTVSNSSALSFQFISVGPNTSSGDGNGEPTRTVQDEVWIHRNRM